MIWINKLLSEETLFEAREVAGSATCKQSETVWKVFFLKVSLLVQFIHENKESLLI